MCPLHIGKSIPSTETHVLVKTCRLPQPPRISHHRMGEDTRHSQAIIALPPRDTCLFCSSTAISQALHVVGYLQTSRLSDRLDHPFWQRSLLRPLFLHFPILLLRRQYPV